MKLCCLQHCISWLTGSVLWNSNYTWTNVRENSVGYVPRVWNWCWLMKMQENHEENEGEKSKVFNKKEWRRRRYSKKYKRKFHWCSTWFSTQTLIALDNGVFIRIFVNEFRPEWQAEDNCTSLLSIIFFSLAR